jgi:5-formyltetrahydrofolate cyclo-ligase
VPDISEAERVQESEHSTDTKAALRVRLLAARAALTLGDLEAARAAIRRKVLDEAQRQGWRTVAAYEAMRTEPSSNELLAGLEGLGIEVITPIVMDDLDLDWRRWPDGPPLGLDALAVTAAGTRLGRGGGSYDRALARIKEHTEILALLYDNELLAKLPAEPWDIPVTAAVTPSGWHGFSTV